MEQVNQEIEAYLQVFVSHCQDDWADWLPLAEFAYNNHVHSTTCCTSFELDSGQHPQMGLEPTRSSTVEAADDFAQQMSQMQDEAKAALKHATDGMAQYYDHQRSPTPAYEVGAKVWLNAQNYTTTCPTKKLDHKWLGPFVIKKVISPTAVKLHLSPQCRWDISPVSSPPLYPGFGPQNITVIMSQESHHQHAFFDQNCRNHFPHALETEM